MLKTSFELNPVRRVNNGPLVSLMATQFDVWKQNVDQSRTNTYDQEKTSLK